jgi:hypothetical protein
LTGWAYYAYTPNKEISLAYFEEETYKWQQFEWQ